MEKMGGVGVWIVKEFYVVFIYMLSTFCQLYSRFAYLVVSIFIHGRVYLALRLSFSLSLSLCVCGRCLDRRVLRFI